MCVSIVDGNMYELTEEIKLDKNKKHNIEIVVDRLMVKPGIEKRLSDSIENVLELSRRADDRGCDRRGTDPVFGEFLLPGLWNQYRGDRTEKFFFQQSVWRLSDLLWTGIQDGV